MLRQRALWLILVLGAAALNGGCQAAGLATLDLANGIARFGDYHRTADIAYGNKPRQKLDVYTPTGDYLPDEYSSDPHQSPMLVSQNLDLANANSKQPRVGDGDEAGKRAVSRDFNGQRGGLPVIVYFHGGDWTDGLPAKNAHRFVADGLTSRGFVAVLVNYRRYPNVRFPAFVRDGAKAVAWVQHHIQGYGGDPDRLYIMGHSAGAHIGAMVTLDETYLREAGGSPDGIQGFIGLAGPYNFLVDKDDPLREEMPDNPLFEHVFGPPTRYWRSQPVNYVDDHEPPMLLLAGALDRRVPLECRKRLVERLHQHGDRVQTKTYGHLDHLTLIGSLAIPLRWVEPVLDDITAFIHACERQRGESNPEQMLVVDTSSQ